MFGESNSGKTRLALEALKESLPTWSLLRWSPDYTVSYIPPTDFINDKRLILFIDDLQNYVPTQIGDSSSKTIILANYGVTTLRTL